MATRRLTSPFHFLSLLYSQGTRTNITRRGDNSCSVRVPVWTPGEPKTMFRESTSTGKIDPVVPGAKLSSLPSLGRFCSNSPSSILPSPPHYHNASNQLVMSTVRFIDCRKRERRLLPCRHSYHLLYLSPPQEQFMHFIGSLIPMIPKSDQNTG